MPISRPLLLLAATLPASHHPVASQVVLHSDPQGHNCPVTISAQPRFDGGLSLVPDQATHRDRAGIHLRLEDPDGRPIHSAEVVLRGRSASHGAQPASLTSVAQPTQTFHVVHGENSPGILTADLWLVHAVTIDSVSVIAIDFASAPKWQTSRTSSCISVPNGNRLVGSLR